MGAAQSGITGATYTPPSPPKKTAPENVSYVSTTVTESGLQTEDSIVNNSLIAGIQILSLLGDQQLSPASSFESYYYGTNSIGVQGWNPLPTVTGMTWPSSAGIANYAGSSAWGTSYSSVNGNITGSGKIVFATSPTFGGTSVFGAAPTSINDFEVTTPGQVINSGFGTSSSYTTTLGPTAYFEKYAGNIPAQSSGTWDTCLAATYHNYDSNASAPVGIQSLMLDYGTWHSGGAGAVAIAGHGISAQAGSNNVWGGWFVAALRTGGSSTNATGIGIEIDICNDAADVGYQYSIINGGTVGLWLNNSSAGPATYNCGNAIGITGNGSIFWHNGITVLSNSILAEASDTTFSGLKCNEAIMLQGTTSSGAAAGGIRFRNYHTCAMDFGSTVFNTGVFVNVPTTTHVATISTECIVVTDSSGNTRYIPLFT